MIKSKACFAGKSLILDGCVFGRCFCRYNYRYLIQYCCCCLVAFSLIIHHSFSAVGVQVPKIVSNDLTMLITKFYLERKNSLKGMLAASYCAIQEITKHDLTECCFVSRFERHRTYRMTCKPGQDLRALTFLISLWPRSESSQSTSPSNFVLNKPKVTAVDSPRAVNPDKQQQHQPISLL